MANGDDVGNVHFVDSAQSIYGGTNYLFRGSSPVNEDHSINYTGLLSALKNAGEKARVTLPLEYKIYDINLQQWENAGEVPQIVAEYEYFQQNVDQGWFDFWETKGTALCPFDENLGGKDVVDYLARHLDDWLPDTLIKRTDSLREILTNAWPPTVVYVHCAGGDDRTGEMMAAYYMKWMNMSWSDVNGKNAIYASGPFGCNNFRAALWYAIYLNLNFGSPTDYELPFPCNNNGCPEVVCSPATPKS